MPVSQFDNYKDIVPVSEVAGLTFHGSSILFTSETQLRYYYILEAGKNIGDYTFKVDGQTVTPVLEKGTYRIDVKVAASDFERDYTLTVTDGTDTQTVTASIYSYLKKAVKKYPADNPMVTVAKAMYNYGNAVKAYLG